MPASPVPDSGSDDDDVPELTDVVVLPMPAAVSSAVAPPALPEPPTADVTESTEVISRVQNQNLEHAAYLRVMSQVDERITSVVQKQVMPEIGSALDQALARITDDLKANIGAMVRTSVEESLRSHLESLRTANAGAASCSL